MKGPSDPCGRRALSSQGPREAMANGRGLDVYLDDEFAFTEEQIRVGEAEAATTRRLLGQR